MKPKETGASDKEIVLRFLDIMFEAEIACESDAEDYLREAGADPDALVDAGTKLLRRYEGRLRMSRAKRLLQVFRSVLRDAKAVSDSSQRRQAILSSLRLREPDLAPAFFRKLQKLDDSALQDDKKLAELWSDFLERDEEDR